MAFDSAGSMAQRLVVSQALPTMLGAAALGVLLAVAAGRWLARHTGTGHVVRRLDELHVAMADWQTAHRAQFRGLERLMTDVEISVLSAEDDAHAAAVQMAVIRRDLIRRVEQVEQDLEIRRLVDEGRIPEEHHPS